MPIFTVELEVLEGWHKFWNDAFCAVNTRVTVSCFIQSFLGLRTTLRHSIPWRERSVLLSKIENSSVRFVLRSVRRNVFVFLFRSFHLFPFSVKTSHQVISQKWPIRWAVAHVPHNYRSRITSLFSKSWIRYFQFPDTSYLISCYGYRYLNRFWNRMART